jgi:hypothetical protein
MKSKNSRDQLVEIANEKIKTWDLLLSIGLILKNRKMI